MTDLPKGSLETILAAKDVDDARTVEIPEWGCSVVIRGLTRGECRKFEQFTEDPEGAEIWAISTALVDPKVTEEEAKKIAADKSVDAVGSLLNAILEASGLQKSAVRAAQNSFLGETGV
ncbi:MAG: hypothetical protein M0R37_07705 [Bacteroidales bacterium]|nr:hypothetical protein [Bacteroidales bacterium]